jgi:sortase A
MNVAIHTSKGARASILPAIWFASYFFLVVGVIVAGYAGYVIADAEVFQAIELRKFNHAAPLVEPHLLTNGEIVGQIEIPSLALKAVILHGDSPALMRRGVVHLPDSPLPGEWGNVALAGHRDTFFRPLRNIRVGEIITVRTSGGNTVQYRVESTSVVPPTDIEVLNSSNRHELTLVTCFPFDYVGHAPNRFIVRAYEIAPGGE